MRKLLSWLLVAAMVLTLLPATVFAAEPEQTPDEFGWGSDGTDWTYWTATEDSIRFLDANAANAAGANGRVWKDILVDSEYTFSFDLQVDPSARVYISFQGLTLECGTNEVGHYWIPQVGNWLAPADGFVHFEISRADGVITVKANPSDGSVTEWTMEPTNTSANVEIGMWNSNNNGFEMKNITYTKTEEPPAEVHTPDEFGWGSDGADWTYWTATEDSIRFLDANAANAAGANGRVWKDILVDSEYTFSFDLKVDPSARVYISFQGLTLECGTNDIGNYWIPQIGNWLAPADGFVHFEITRADDVITVKANPSDGEVTEWTMEPANTSANVEIGMWNSNNNGFEMKNITYTKTEEPPAEVHTPNEFGWGSDGTDWTYWTATEDSIRFLDANAANAAGANGRVWKSILTDSAYTFSFDLKVDPNARVYISFQGLTLECGTNDIGNYWITQIGNWLAPADGFVHFEITRADDVITVKANPSDGEVTEWTMEPTNTSANVEIGMWNSDNNGFEMKNITYTPCEHLETEIRDARDATCVEDGYTGDTYCQICGEKIAEGEVVPAPGHTPGEPVRENETAPTCSSAGGYDTVVYCTVCTAELSRDHTDIPVLDHTPGEPVKENEVAATCTAAGGYDTVVYCTVCETEISREHTDIPALGHDWNEPTYVWAEDNGSVTATRTCKRDESHAETEQVNTTYEVTKEATYEEEGKITYTATFTNPAFAAQVKKVATPKLVKPVLNNPFTDVKDSDYFYDAVLWAVNAEPQITNGTGATTFSPNDTCTRAQVVTFLWRAKGCPEPTKSENPFKDVKETDYFYKAVLWAVENEITNGTAANTFSPNAGCTRGQVVTFLWRAEGKPAPEKTENPFGDVKDSDFYYSAVLWAVEKEITKGTSDTTFSPSATCTRGQIVTFLYRDLA